MVANLLTIRAQTNVVYTSIRKSKVEKTEILLRMRIWNTGKGYGSYSQGLTTGLEDHY